ncbi:aminotransferase class III-fold pyridoxal phosphate-dependent enzyme [bacterium]|nr:aminotransferase class III-fold pyridoxal phosphate-dependent enzyme [bacterium]
MNRSSIYRNIIDFKRSKGSYLFDKRNGNRLLDFFGQYATLTLGYNHPIFKTSTYLNEIANVAHQKISNCELFSDESTEFDISFRNFTCGSNFTHYHYACTGALAIEAAVKTSIDYKGPGYDRVISFKKSFHGINGYGGFLTDKFSPVNLRLDGFPSASWDRVINPIVHYENNLAVINEELVQSVLSNVESIITTKNNVCAILVEPIQCTFGDRYFPTNFFTGLRRLADQYDIPLIFDEIQVGFCVTGKIWYHNHLSVKPDIIVFGKKTQLSGIAVQKKFTDIFNQAIRLEVTWDADIMDMIRCKHIIKAIKDGDILGNVNNMSDLLLRGLSRIECIENIRHCGLLFAFDLATKKQRDLLFYEMKKRSMLCNPTGDKTIRLRPNLCVTKEEINHALSIMAKASKKI